MNVVMLLDNCFDPDVRVYKEAKYLIEKGNNVEILCLDKKNKYMEKPNEIYEKIKVIRFFSRTEKTTKFLEKHVHIAKILKPFIYFYWLIKFFMNIKKYLKKENVDILHCHDFIMALGATIFLRKYKMVFDMHEYYCNKNNKLLNKIIKAGVRFVQKHAAWIVYVNDYQKKDMREEDTKKLIEIPNYPSKHIFKDIDKSESKLLRISYIGAVRDYKSLSTLLKAKLDNKLFKVNIYGYGSMYEQILDLAIKLGKEECIYGAYDGVRQIEGLYKNTDILYCVYDNHDVNWKQSMPVKAFEAILTLTPIIANPNSALGDFVEKNNIGFCIRNDDAKQLEKVLIDIKNNPSLLSEKKENMRKIQWKYSWENCVKNLDIIYN